MTGQEHRESHRGVTAELSCEGGWGSQGQEGERIPAAERGAQGRHSAEQQPLVACGLLRGREEAPWAQAELAALLWVKLLCARLSCSGWKARSLPQPVHQALGTQQAAPHQGRSAAPLNASPTCPSPPLIHPVNHEIRSPSVLPVYCLSKPLSSPDSPAGCCPFPLPFPANASEESFVLCSSGASSCSLLNPRQGLPASPTLSPELSSSGSPAASGLLNPVNILSP